MEPFPDHDLVETLCFPSQRGVVHFTDGNEMFPESARFAVEVNTCLERAEEGISEFAGLQNPFSYLELLWSLLSCWGMQSGCQARLLTLLAAWLGKESYILVQFIPLCSPRTQLCSPWYRAEMSLEVSVPAH